MQDLRAIVDEKLANNRVHREAMFVTIASGEAIAFIGAGLSAPLKYPPWPNLLATLENRANQLAAFSASAAAKLDVLQHAEEISNHFKTHGNPHEFNSIIGREFAPRTGGSNCTATHRRLAKLPFRAFPTTNYDVCQEQALTDHAVETFSRPCPDPGVIIKANGADRHRVSLFLRSITEKLDQQRFVAHLHGRHDDTDNIILTASAYVNAYGFTLNGILPDRNRPVTLHRQLAWSLFATRRMVFFGCSMDDPYIKALLDTVASDLWEWGVTTHYVVLPLDEQSAKSIDAVCAQFLRFGLQPVLYDNLGGDFSLLDQLLDEAIERCPPDVSTVTKPDSASKPPTVFSHHPAPMDVSIAFGQRLLAWVQNLLLRLTSKNAVQLPEAVLQKLDVGPDWLEEVNRTTENSLKKNED